MATVTKLRKLVNPGRRRRNATKRRLSPLQKLYFGSKRQRAAVTRNAGKRSLRKTLKARVKAMKAEGGWTKAGMQYNKVYTREHANFLGKKRSRKGHLRYKPNKARRKRNVSSIVTVWPLGHANPGRKRRSRKRNTRKVVVINKGAKMARKRRNRSKIRNVRHYRRRRNYGTRTGRSWSTYSLSGRFGKKRKGNPGRRRRRNPSMRRYHRRRNPGMLTGVMGRIAGGIGGIAVTKLLMGFVPTSFTGGVLGPIVSAVVAVAQGKLIGKVSKNSQLGDDFMVGGLMYAVATALNQFFPTAGTYTGISGMGLIGGSSFYTPQVSVPGNMGQFVLPQMVSGMAIAPGPQPNTVAGGVGSVRRRGRLL